MKRILLYVVIVGATFFAPLEQADVAKLEPIEAIGVVKTKNQISIITDTGAEGVGRNTEDALQDLIENTAGIVYLDTAKYLLVAETAVEEINYLRNDLKKSVKLCIWDGKADLSDAVKYLSVHGDLPKLGTWNANMKLPEYVCEKIS